MKKKEKKPIFERPKFDEIEYMRKEIEGAKIAVITVVFAIPFAVISWQLTLFNLSLIGGFIGLLALAVLKPFYKIVGVDTGPLDYKGWLGNIATCFFTWLSIWVLLINPPFSDFTAPTIGKVQIWRGEDWTNVQNGDSVRIELNGSLLKVKAKVTDNSGIHLVRIYLSGGTNKTQTASKIGEERYYWSTQFDGISKTAYELRIEAWDNNGHKSSFYCDILVV